MKHIIKVYHFVSDSVKTAHVIKSLTSQVSLPDRPQESRGERYRTQQILLLSQKLLGLMVISPSHGILLSSHPHGARL